MEQQQEKAAPRIPTLDGAAFSISQLGADLSLPYEEGFIPLYNPLPIYLTVSHSSLCRTIGAREIKYVPAPMANRAVGPDNLGGVFSHYGLRRLYPPEPRYADAAETANLSLAAFVARLNKKIVAEAEADGRAYCRMAGLLAPDGKLKAEFGPDGKPQRRRTDSQKGNA